MIKEEAHQAHLFVSVCICVSVFVYLLHIDVTIFPWPWVTMRFQSAWPLTSDSGISSAERVKRVMSSLVASTASLHISIAIARKGFKVMLTEGPLGNSFHTMWATEINDALNPAAAWEEPTFACQAACEISAVTTLALFSNRSLSVCLSLSCQGFPGDFGERGPPGLDGEPVSPVFCFL